jgi:UDP-2,3-diacylglucosamine hydrolase
MIDAVFISDLHLHPQNAVITARFNYFVQWAAKNARVVYILGDFLHVWPGDDALDDWSMGVFKQLAWLTDQGVKVYFMPGNRDFLLSRSFARAAKVIMLTEPFVVRLGDEPVLLVHGDRLCTNDTGHQWLRRLTRNRIFTTIFLKLPLIYRSKLVNTVRQSSQRNRQKLSVIMDVVPAFMIKLMNRYQVQTLIHGHTHKHGLTMHSHQGHIYRQYVLSDWDDAPVLLCYDRSSGFYFIRQDEV